MTADSDRLQWRDTPAGYLRTALRVSVEPSAAALEEAEQRVEEIARDRRLRYGTDLSVAQLAGLRVAFAPPADAPERVLYETSEWQAIFDARARLRAGVAWEGPDGGWEGSPQIAGRARAAIGEHDARAAAADIAWANGSPLTRSVARPR